MRPIFDSQKCDLVPLLRSRRTEVYSNNNDDNNNDNNNTDAIWMKGMDMLKRSFMFANQTTLTFVTIIEPRLP